MIFPFKLDIQQYKLPIANILLLILTIAAFLTSLFPQYFHYLEMLILEDWDPVQMLGYIFLHANTYILVVNIVFIFVFGNAVCSVIGNLFYPILFLIFGAAGAAAHLYFDSSPVVGSGAVVSGMIGIILVWFPKSKVKFYYFFWFFSKLIHGSFKIQMILVAAVFFVIDLFILKFYGVHPDYYIYAGGFAVGFLLAVLSQLFHIWHLGDETLLDLIKGEKSKPIVGDISELDFVESEVELPLENFSEYIPQAEPEEIKREPLGSSKEVDEPVKVPVPEFRILRIQDDHESVRCFIVNEGDTIENVTITSDDVAGCEIEPYMKFKSHDAGIIKYSKSIDSRNLIRFKIIHGNNEEKYLKEFILNTISNKIEAV